VTSDEERAKKRDSREGRGKAEGRRREERVGKAGSGGKRGCREARDQDFHYFRFGSTILPARRNTNGL
jgi:hypothetical protein